jgi:hypothetical protein
MRNTFFLKRGDRYKTLSHLIIKLNDAIKNREITTNMANQIMEWVVNDKPIEFEDEEQEYLWLRVVYPKFVHFQKVWFE